MPCRGQVENKHTTTLMRKYKHKLLQQRNENLLQQRNDTQTLATSNTSHNDSTSGPLLYIRPSTLHPALYSTSGPLLYIRPCTAITTLHPHARCCSSATKFVAMTWRSLELSLLLLLPMNHLSTDSLNMACRHMELLIRFVCKWKLKDCDGHRCK